MALTLECGNREVMTIDDFVDFVNGCIDVDDFDSLCESAPAFKALLNNPSLISDLIARELRAWRDFQSGNSYIATTLILARTPRFFIRANMWFPQKPRSRPHGDSSIYGLTQDHNFTFMTGGYAGGGYTIEIYELEPGRIEGLKGERVDLQFLERTTLPAGKIMLYRAMRAVHRQSRPEELSISINLVVPTHAKSRPQYFFDLERGEITTCDYPEQGRALSLFKLARFAGDQTTNTLLADIAARSATPHLRAGAYEALWGCDQCSALAIREQVLADADPHVRALVRSLDPAPKDSRNRWPSFPISLTSARLSS